MDGIERCVEKFFSGREDQFSSVKPDRGIKK
jgi:hypothetical protein